MEAACFARALSITCLGEMELPVTVPSAKVGGFDYLILGIQIDDPENLILEVAHRVIQVIEYLRGRLKYRLVDDFFL